MPELPDVEILKRYVDATSLHHPIERVEVDASRMLDGISARGLRRTCKDQEFRETARHGKYLFVRLSKGPWLVLHFGMTGALSYCKAREDRPEHTRLLFLFDNGFKLAGKWQRRLGHIAVADDPATFASDKKLGPDALDPKMDLKEFARMLRGRRGGVKSALMDQHFLAGIGNVYSDEILFQSRIRPDVAAGTLGDARMAALHRAMLHVLRLAIERHADPHQLPKSWLLPHRHEGGKCPRCDGILKRTRAAGRTAYYCPKCQS